MTQLQRLAIAPSQFHRQQIALTPEQQHYLSRVLRLQAGDRFIAMNGQGQWWLAELEGAQAKILESIPVHTELPLAVTLVVALPKGSGFDEVVRQVTALGVTTIAPVISDRTLLHPSPQKLERWRRIAQEAAEQAERQIVPQILKPVPFTTRLQAETSTFRYICTARGNAPHLLDCLFNHQSKIQNLNSKIVIAIGPEGGWTTAEAEQAIAANFQSVSLGRRILTTVLAPTVALSLIAAVFEMESINSVLVQHKLPS